MSSRTKATASPRLARKTTGGAKGATRLKTSFPDSRKPGVRKDGERGAGRNKVSKHVDAKVTARNNALNAMGGVKVDVFVRIRPPNDKEDPETVNIRANKTDGETPDEQVIMTDATGHETVYNYDKVYGPERTQEDIYDDAVAPIVDQVSRGMSCAVFAYGQTGSGKTHTMRGSSLSMKQDPSDHGIIQRSVNNLFRRLNEQDYTDIKVSVSFLEIYNEELEDMLEPKNKKKLLLIDDNKRGCVCANLTEMEVGSVEEVLHNLTEADKHTKVSETKMNKFSNRAHRIFTIIANFKRFDTMVTSTLTFIDLAGSEDISKSGAKGMTAREAAHINKSLLTLGRVINALACNEKHIPYRDSKLTRLLSEALGGVCKTSFIACVSPCSSSTTETVSTLKYAERAMEALNISQLPRWKQDEIMIDGLTRRVQHLIEELAHQDKCHKEELVELKNKNDALEAEKKELEISNWRLNRKIEKLVVRKKQLKTGLAVMTSQRDVLHTQKEHLRDELLFTRKERDGYLSDRAELTMVLQGVRVMRQRLLEAQQFTEKSLTSDAVMLKEVVESCIADIGDLHTEIARKKSISSRNEALADEYKDRMSSKIRDIVQLVDDFKTSQGESHDQVNDQLLSLKNQDQIDTNSNRQRLSSLASTTSELLAQISAFCSETEHTIAAKIQTQETNVEKFGSSMAALVAKFKAQTSAHLEQLRTEAAGAEAKVAEWAESVSAKLTERESAINDFNMQLNTSLGNLETSLKSASTAHVDHLTKHKADLVKHLEDERATMTQQSEELMSQIQTYVNRMVTDFSNKSVRRTELAVQTLGAQTELLSTQTSDMLSDQLGQQKALKARTTDFHTHSVNALKEGKEQSDVARSQTDVRLQAITAKSQETDTDAQAGADAATASTTTFVSDIKSEMDATVAYSKDRATKAAAKTLEASQQVSTSAEAIRNDESAQNTALAATNDAIRADLKKAMENIKSTMEHAHDDLFDTEADGVKYVVQDIVRDTQAAPVKKGVTYPHEFHATDPYATILADLPDEWGREAKILSGDLEEGKGTDFSGELGKDDPSGLLESTGDKPVSEEKMQYLTDAAAMSSPEDYESQDFPPQHAPNEDEEITVIGTNAESDENSTPAAN